MIILLDNGHGFDTPGKRSPDGHFREYAYNRYLAFRIRERLQQLGLDCRLLVPEREDISLQERCRRVNKICQRFGAGQVILISIHINAAGTGQQWMDARGWSCFTSIGETRADSLATCLYEAAKAQLPGHNIRKDYTDGDPDIEKNFYILRHTRCRTGKVMKYDPETGHRIKDPDVLSRITWVHSLMRQAGQLPPTWNLTQCLFGEHLLKEQPEKPVALVESEKTAVICAGLMPKYVWLATGGKSCVNDRLLVLAHRKVVAFPDVDGYQEWTEKLAKYNDLSSVTPGLTRGLDITVSPLLQQSATTEDMEAHIDIADWLIRTRVPMFNPGLSRHSEAFLKAAQFVDPKYHAELEGLIDDFELEFVGFEPKPSLPSEDFS